MAVDPYSREVDQKARLPFPSSDPFSVADLLQTTVDLVILEFAPMSAEYQVLSLVTLLEETKQSSSAGCPKSSSGTLLEEKLAEKD